MQASHAFPGLQCHGAASSRSTPNADDVQAADELFPGLPDSASLALNDDPDWDIEALLAAAHWALRLQRRVATAWLAYVGSAKEQRLRCFQSWVQLVEERRRVRIRGCLLHESLYIPKTRKQVLTVWAREALISSGLRVLSSKQKLAAQSCAMAAWRWAAGRCAKARRMACWQGLRSQQQVLVAWQINSAAVARSRMHAQLRVQRKVEQRLGRALQGWSRWWRDCTERRLQLRYMLERFSEKLQRQICTCWQRLSQNSHRRRLHFNGVMSERRLLFVWQPWRALVVRHRCEMQHAIERTTADMLRRHFWRWRHFCEERQARLMSLQILSAKRIEGIMLDAFHFWREDCNAIQKRRCEQEALAGMPTPSLSPDLLDRNRVQVPVPAAVKDCKWEHVERYFVAGAGAAAAHSPARVKAAGSSCQDSCLRDAVSLLLREIPSPSRLRRPSRDSHAATSSVSQSLSDDDRFHIALRESQAQRKAEPPKAEETALSTDTFSITCVDLQFQDAPEHISEVQLSPFANTAANVVPTAGLAHKIASGIAMGNKLEDSNTFATPVANSLKEAVHMWRGYVFQMRDARSILQAWLKQAHLSAGRQLAWKNMVASVLTLALVTGWWVDQHLEALGDSNLVKASGNRLACARRLQGLELCSCMFNSWHCLLISLTFNRQRQTRSAWLMFVRAAKSCGEQRESKFSVCKSRNESYLVHRLFAIWSIFRGTSRGLKSIQQRTGIKQSRFAFDVFHLGSLQQRVSRQSFHEVYGSHTLVWTAWCISMAHSQSSTLRILLIAFRFWISQLQSSLIRQMLLNNLRHSGKLRAWKAWAVVHEAWRAAVRQGIRELHIFTQAVFHSWHFLYHQRRAESDAFFHKSLQNRAFSEWSSTVCKRKQAIETLLKSMAGFAFYQPWIQLRVFGARCHLSKSSSRKAMSRVWKAWSHIWRREKVEQRTNALRSMWHAWSIAIAALRLEVSLLEQEARRNSHRRQRYRAFHLWETAVNELILIREEAKSTVTLATESKRVCQQSVEEAGALFLFESKAAGARSDKETPKPKRESRTSIWQHTSAMRQLLSLRSSAHPAAVGAQGCNSECRDQGKALGALQGSWRARYVHQRLQSVDHLATAMRIIGEIQWQCIHTALRQWHMALEVQKLTALLELRQGRRAERACFAAWWQHCGDIELAIASQRVATRRSCLRGALHLLLHVVQLRYCLKDELRIVAAHLAGRTQKGKHSALLSWRHRAHSQHVHRRSSAVAVGWMVRARQHSALRWWSRQQRCRHIQKCALLRRKQELQFSALRFWSFLLASRRACRSAAQVAAKSAADQLSTEVLSAWKGLHAYHRHCRCSAEAIREAVLSNRRIGVLLIWKQLSVSERSCRQAAFIVQQRCSHRWQRDTLLMWRGIITYDHHCASVAQRIAEQVANKQQRMTIHAWQRFWREERLLAATSCVIVERVAAQCLCSAFKLWSEASCYQRRCQLAASMISKRANGSLLLQVWGLWGNILKSQDDRRKKGHEMRQQALSQQMHIVVALWRSQIMFHRTQYKSMKFALTCWHHSVLRRHRLADASELLAVHTSKRRQKQALQCWNCLLSAQHLRQSMRARAEQHRMTRRGKCRQLAIQKWHRFCRVRLCQQGSTAACVKLHMMWQQRAAVRDWKDALPSLQMQQRRLENTGVARSSLRRHRQRAALRSWLCVSRHALTNRRVKKQWQTSALTQIFQCFWHLVRVRRAGLRVRSRRLSSHMGRWATAAKAFHSFQMLDVLRQGQIKRLSLMWLKDSWLAPSLLHAWRQEAAKAQRLVQAGRFLHLLKIDCLSLVTQKWLQLVKRRRAEKKARERVQSLRQRSALSSWWRCFTVNRRCPIASPLSLLAVCVKCWRGDLQINLATKEIAKAVLHIWRCAVEEHQSYLRSLQRFYWCCKQSNVIAAKAAAREALALLSVWHFHAAKYSFLRQCYAQGMYRAHWRPALIAFRGFRLWQEWQQNLPQVECLAFNMTTAVNLVLVGVFDRWSVCSATLALSRRSAMALLRSTWKSWQDVILRRKRMSTGARKLLSVPLSWGLQAVCQHLQVAVAAEERALREWQLRLQAAILQAWKDYLSAASVERTSWALLRWKKWTCCTLLQRWLAVWRQQVHVQRRKRQLHVPGAMQWWHCYAGKRAEARRRLGFAGAFASRQHLRRVFVGWLLASLQGSCHISRIAQPLPMTAILPGGPSIDRLSLWAAALQQNQQLHNKQEVQHCRSEHKRLGVATVQVSGKVPGRLENVVARRRPRCNEKENRRPIALVAQ